MQDIKPSPINVEQVVLLWLLASFIMALNIKNGDLSRAYTASHPVTADIEMDGWMDGWRLGVKSGNPTFFNSSILFIRS